MKFTKPARLVERVFIDTVRERFEMFGYGPIETRSVEPLDVLLKQGETDKEIYIGGRLNPSITLRVAIHSEFEHPPTDKSNTRLYHGGRLCDEVAALFSLSLGIRLKAGPIRSPRVLSLVT